LQKPGLARVLFLQRSLRNSAPEQRFADAPNKLVSEVFAIVFDPAGRAMYRTGFGVNDRDRLADIDSDTRSERRVTP
jgi:hypothetical protein